MTYQPSDELVEAVAQGIHAHGVIVYGVTREWDRVTPPLQEQYRAEARAILRDFRSELKIIDPAFDDDKWSYTLGADGFVVKELKPQPPIGEADKASDVSESGRVQEGE